MAGAPGKITVDCTSILPLDSVRMLMIRGIAMNDCVMQFAVYDATPCLQQQDPRLRHKVLYTIAVNMEMQRANFAITDYERTVVMTCRGGLLLTQDQTFLHFPGQNTPIGVVDGLNLHNSLEPAVQNQMVWKMIRDTNGVPFTVITGITELAKMNAGVAVPWLATINGQEGNHSVLLDYKFSASIMNKAIMMISALKLMLSNYRMHDYPVATEIPGLLLRGGPPIPKMNVLTPLTNFLIRPFAHTVSRYNRVVPVSVMEVIDDHTRKIAFIAEVYKFPDKRDISIEFRNHFGSLLFFANVNVETLHLEVQLADFDKVGYIDRATDTHYIGCERHIKQVIKENEVAASIPEQSPRNPVQELVQISDSTKVGEYYRLAKYSIVKLKMEMALEVNVKASILSHAVCVAHEYHHVQEAAALPTFPDYPWRGL